MKILALTNLLTSAWDPLRASFNRQQFDRLAEHHDLEVLVAIAFHSRWRCPPGQQLPLRTAHRSDCTFWYPHKLGSVVGWDSVLTYVMNSGVDGNIQEKL